MSFGDAIKSGLSNYVKFNGRAGRSEFWWFVLFAYVIAVVISLIEGAIGTGMILSVIWWLAMLLPVLGLYFRRLHDVDRSAWWLLIGLIPLVGTIVLIVFWAAKGTPGDNKYGAPAS
jgi:uncharacterized membrane protein YhaH (DUF805 family)